MYKDLLGDKENGGLCCYMYSETLKLKLPFRTNPKDIFFIEVILMRRSVKELVV